MLMVTPRVFKRAWCHDGGGGGEDDRSAGAPPASRSQLAARSIRSFFLTRLKARRQLAREVVNIDEIGRLSLFLGLFYIRFYAQEESGRRYSNVVGRGSAPRLVVLYYLKHIA